MVSSAFYSSALWLGCVIRDRDHALGPPPRSVAMLRKEISKTALGVHRIAGDVMTWVERR